jgi:hypothetical protein
MKKMTAPERAAVPAFACALFLLAAGTMAALGQEEPDFPKGTITVSGRVRLVGTAVFPSLVITDDQDRDWHIEGEDRKKLAGMEQRLVKVRGAAEYREVVLANGEKAGVRRFLRNIVILN